jgi:hypothetical protein
MITNAEKIQKEKRIKKEIKRIKAIYAGLSNDVIELFEGLIKRAAYMRVTLEDYEADLDKNGYTELFQQSEKCEAYERARPVAQLYNSMIKNYKDAMKQLADKMPTGSKSDTDDINEFCTRRK